MCGRVTVTTSSQSIAEFFLALNLADIGPRYNIAPTQPIIGIRVDPALKDRVACLHHWGLIPSWSKDMKIAARLTNARSETLAEKPSFRGAFRRQRCLIPVDGFFEWKRTEKGKQPYYFKKDSGHLLAFAGLWEHWSGPAGEEILSATIITTDANPLMRPLHHRMPVILDQSDHEQWLDPAIDSKKTQSLLAPYAGNDLICFPVSTHVNNSRNEGPACIAPVTEPSDNDPPVQLNLF